MIYSFHLPAIYDPGKNLKRLFVSTILKRSAITLLSLFSPLYIFKALTGVGISKESTLVYIALFFMFLYTSKLVALPFAEKISRKVGFKGVMRVSIVPFILFAIVLYFSSTSYLLFYVAAIFWGIHAGLYWLGYHGYFVNFANKNHFGQSIGEVDFLVTATSVVMPILGVFLVNAFGFRSLFLFSVVLMAGGLFLLGKDDDRRQVDYSPITDIFKLCWQHKKVSTAYIGSAIQGAVYNNLWPLYLYITLGGITVFGFVTSASAFVAAIFAILIGKVVDKKGERQAILLGSPLVSVTWVMRLFLNSPYAFVISDSIWQFGERMVSNSLNTLSYEKAHNGKLVRAILFREVNLTMGTLISLMVFMLMVLLGGSVKLTFWIALACSFLPIFVFLKNGDKK